MSMWTKKVLVVPVGLALAASVAGFAQQQTPTPASPAPGPDGSGHQQMRMQRNIEIREDRGGQSGEGAPKRMFMRTEDSGGMHGGSMGMHGGMSMHREHMDFWKSPETVKRLALTPEQVTKLNGIKESSEIEAIHLRAALEEQHVKMQSMMESPTFDPKAMDLAIDKMADSKAALEKAEAKSHVAERAVLTPDQWTKLHTPPEHHMMQPGTWHGREPMNPGQQGPA